ncbi:hypothetical protein P3W45_001028 [Vairimorpha bombi]
MKYFIFSSLIFLFVRNYKRLIYKSVESGGNYTLLIAHPDDESMFFSPTLINLKNKIQIICLSKGDTLFKFDYIREHELSRLCKDYNIKLSMYSFFDNDEWDRQKIIDILYLHYLQTPSNTLITFDEQGVSGHRNHISCYEAVKAFSLEVSVKTMYLKSLNLLQKYICDCRTEKIEYALEFTRYFEAVKMMWAFALLARRSNQLSYQSWITTKN